MFVAYMAKETKKNIYEIEQYWNCVLDESEQMVLRVAGEINSQLKFIYRKNRFLKFSLGKLLSNTLTSCTLTHSHPITLFNFSQI